MNDNAEKMSTGLCMKKICTYYGPFKVLAMSILGDMLNVQLYLTSFGFSHIGTKQVAYNTFIFFIFYFLLFFTESTCLPDLKTGLLRIKFGSLKIQTMS